MFNTRRRDRQSARPGTTCDQDPRAEVDGRRLATSTSTCSSCCSSTPAAARRNLVAGGMLALFEHPDQRRKLTASLDALLPTAVEMRVTSRR
jgi:hypothetical protein